MRIGLKQNQWIVLVFILALGLRLLLMATWYTDSLSHFESGDYALYTIGAEHFEVHKDFSNSLFLVRPPFFSLVIYVLRHNDFVVLLVNAIVGALIAPLTCILAQRLGMTPTGAIVGGGLVAIDFTGIMYSSFLGPEPFSNLFLLMAMIAVLTGFNKQGKISIGWGIIAGVLLVLSFYARPTAYLLWIGIALWLFLADRTKKVMIGAFVLISMFGAVGWIVHNGRVFGNYAFSTVGPYTLAYYHAASVEHLATGDSMDVVYTSIARQVEERLGHDTTQVTGDRRHHHLAASPEVADALNLVAIKTFAKHPFIFLLTFPLGFVRMYGQSTLSSPLLSVLVMGWHVTFFLGTCYGLWLAFRHKKWLLFWCVLLICSYFTAGTLWVKTSGTTRMRSGLSPFMAVATAYAITVLINRRRQHRIK